MLNKELFYRDPTDPSNEIPNEGVAKVGYPGSPQEWEVLRFELEHFVCDGQYEADLDRILAGYLGHMDQPMQPAVWVSGFYGSGKSHFLKVLQNLWNDTSFPGGASARGLTQVSERVALQLRELETVGKRTGGLWAAAGTLGAGASGSVRLSFLGIIFDAAGLPTNYSAAKLVLWLKQEGVEQQVRDHLEKAGRTLERELHDMSVSVSLAEALMAALPGFATAPADALKRVGEAYPKVDDISNDEFCGTLRDVLLVQAAAQGKDGKLPCILIIMDELQQYIGDDVDHADKVLRIVEAVVAKFGSQVLFVASGQSAMGATPQLLRLQDRFTIPVEFTDTDVDRVVRQVVLRKKEDKRALLEEQLTEVSGEVSRHLVDTRIGPAADDGQTIVADYPLLPTRRRFWEFVLRAIDRAGASGQLRTQLRTVQEAAKYVGSMSVGHVVPADFIYERQVGGMLHTGVLSKDIHDTIADLRDASAVDGDLKYRVAALVFLIGQVREANRDLGLRATAAILADLLVVDLTESSAKLRADVEAVLKALTDDGTLDLAGGEYSLRDEVSQAWHQHYMQCLNRTKDEGAAIQQVRLEKLKEALAAQVGNLTVTQGDAKVPRRGQFSFDDDPPQLGLGHIPVWVRDEWSVGSLKAAEDEAAARGSEDPMVHLLIPKRDSDAIKEAIATYRAAQQTLDAKVDASATEEGATARASMQARRDSAEERVRSLIAGLLADARVLLSGGVELRDANLRGNIETGLRSAAQRMYPKFDAAEGRWDRVVAQVSQGSGSALEAIDYHGEPKDQKVCAEVIKHLQGSAKRGSDVRDYFMSAPYGWPQDAVDGALMVLSRGGDLKVQQNGVDASAKEVTQDKLGKFTFSVEQQPFTTAQRLALRTLFSKVDVPCKSGEEGEALYGFLQKLIEAGQKAGGEAPLPVTPNLRPVKSIEALSGNERLNAAFEAREQLEELWKTWTATAREAERRISEWKKLQSLTAQSASLPVATHLNEQIDAILASRSLLVEPDPVRPLIASVVDALRAAITEYHDTYVAARKQGLDELEAVEEYAALPSETWRKIVDQCGLGPLPDVDLGTDVDVLEELARTPLDRWSDRIEGMKGRIERARIMLAEAAKPEIPIEPYTPPSRTLATVADVEAYVTEMRAALMKAIESGSRVVIKR